MLKALLNHPTVDILCAAALALALVVMLRGKAANRRVAQRALDTLHPVSRQHFSQPLAPAETVSWSSYRFYATGHADARGSLVTLDLVRRQDPTYPLFAVKAPQRDVICMDFPLARLRAPLCVAAVSRRFLARFIQRAKDVRGMAHQVEAPPLRAPLVVLTDMAASVPQVLRRDVRRCTDAAGHALLGFHVTDANPYFAAPAAVRVWLELPDATALLREPAPHAAAAVAPFDSEAFLALGENTRALLAAYRLGLALVAAAAQHRLKKADTDKALKHRRILLQEQKRRRAERETEVVPGAKQLKEEFTRQFRAGGRKAFRR